MTDPQPHPAVAKASAAIHSPGLPAYTDARIHQGPEGLWLVLKAEGQPEAARLIERGAVESLWRDTDALIVSPAFGESP